MLSKRLILKLFVAFLALFPASVLAQTGSISPYSRFGLGDVQAEGFTYQIGMGGLAAALATPEHINFINPATYLADSNVVFGFGAKGEITQIRNKSQSNTRNSASFSYFSLAFPIVKNKISFAFGLLPFSSVGYNIQIDSDEIPNVGIVRYKYEGTGGYNKFFFGAGGRIYKGLSAGFNASYMFGTIRYMNSLEFPYNTNYYNSRYENARSIKGFYFNYGLYYEKPLTHDRIFSAGLVVSPSMSLKGINDQFYYNYTISGFGNEIVKDSVYSEQESRGTIRLPGNYRIGFTYGKNHGWKGGLDFSYTTWNDYNSFGTKDSLDNSYSVHAGGTHTGNNMIWFVGARYAKTYLQLNGNQLNDYGITFGLGLKKSALKKPASIIQMAFEIGRRGTRESSLIEENYIRLHLGFSLSDIWFGQNRYD